MPRPRKPPHLLRIEGKFRRGRHAAGLPGGGPLGDAPPTWKIPGKLLWAEVKNAVPKGAATKADRFIVELTCRLLMELREGACTAPLAAQLRACFEALGLTPAARARLSAPEVPEDDPALKHLT